MKIDALLPMAAPAPAGFIVGVQLYKSTLDAIGTISPEWSTPIHTAAAIFAIGGCVGMIGVEMVAYKQAGLAFAEKQAGAAVVALTAGVICSALVVWAVSTGNKPQAVIASVIVSIAGYIALAARDFLARRRGVAAALTADANAANQFALDLEKEKTKQAAAAARYAKASAAPVRDVRDSTRTDEQEEKVNSRALGVEKIAEIRAYQIANPTKTVREVATACGVSLGSVSKYGVQK